jgi:hypothetical protein
MPRGEKRKGMPGADALDPHRAAGRSRRGAGPAAAEQRDIVATPGEALEDLVEVNLGAAGLWIVAILPVDHDQAHYSRPMWRASASRTPLTNRALVAPA